MEQTTISQQILFGQPKRNANNNGKHRCICSGCRKLMAKQPSDSEEEAFVEADAVLDNKRTILYWCRDCLNRHPERIVPDGTRMRTDYEGNHVLENTTDRFNYLKRKAQQGSKLDRSGRRMEIRPEALTLI